MSEHLFASPCPGIMAMLPDRVTLPEVLTGPAVFAGDDTCLTVGLLAGLRAVRPEQPLLIVDGANAFAPFFGSDLARKSGVQPPALLDQTPISRAFPQNGSKALAPPTVDRK